MAVDVKVSWLELDTAAVDVAVSWVEFDTVASVADVKVSWLEFDTDAATEADIGGRLRNWFRRIKDTSVSVAHTRVRTRVRPVYARATDPAAVTGKFTGYMTSLPGATLDAETVHARVLAPAVRVRTAVQPFLTSGSASVTLAATRVTVRSNRVEAGAGAAVVLGFTRTYVAARDVDEVYAQIDTSDEDLLLLASELVYNQP